MEEKQFTLLRNGVNWQVKVWPEPSQYDEPELSMDVTNDVNGKTFRVSFTTWGVMFCQVES